MTPAQLAQAIRNHIIAKGSRRSLAAKLDISEAQIAEVERLTGLSFPGKTPQKPARWNRNPAARKTALEQLK